MSLINRMLQELDARRSDGGAAPLYSEQVRAVPGRRRIHPAWWVAAVLALLLIALVAWMLLRPPAASAPKARLPLKLDLDIESQPGTISVVPQAAPPTPPTPATATAQPMPPTIPTAVPPPLPINTALVNVFKPMPSTPEAPGTSASGREWSAFSATPVNSSDVTQPGKAVGTSSRPVRKSVREEAPVPATQASRETAPATLDKQIKEPSPQQRAENEYRKGLTAMQQGRPAEAIAAFEQALQLDARNAGARQALIGALIEAKRTDDAILRTREGLAQDPAQPGLAMVLARLQTEKGELAGAIETLERALPYGAERADYQAFLGALLQRERRHKEAVEHYLAALKTTPQNGVWWMGLGISLQADNRLPEAREAFKRAKSTGSLSPELTAFVDGRLAQLAQ